MRLREVRARFPPSSGIIPSKKLSAKTDGGKRHLPPLRPLNLTQRIRSLRSRPWETSCFIFEQMYTASIIRYYLEIIRFNQAKRYVMSTRAAAASNAVVNTISKHTTPTRALAVGLAVSLSYLVYAGMNALQCRQEVEDGGYDVGITELAKAGCVGTFAMPYAFHIAVGSAVGLAFEHFVSGPSPKPKQG